MDFDLRNAAVLVTGATRGIGKAIAIAYAREGARVAITYANDQSAAESVVAEIDSLDAEGLALKLDLADPVSISRTVAQAAERFGGIDVLVANAVRWPIDARGALAEAQPDVWRHALRANLEGTVETVRAGMPHLARSSAGRIVLISSGVSRDGRAGATAYGAAKGALDGLMASLKWEAGEQGVLVNIVSPGFTITENNLATFSDDIRESVRQRTPSGRLSVPEDLASAVLYLGSPANGNISGAYVPVAGGTD
jgi:NAD(P)-dependent dehydrogenase (short-subunit alcohol dehydrogenase family)